MSSHEEGPYICVWDSSPSSAAAGSPVLPELTKIQLGKGDRGVLALGFSPDGTKLAAVVSDNAHTVYVFDWRTGAQLSSGRGCMGEPPQVGCWAEGDTACCDWGSSRSMPCSRAGCMLWVWMGM